MQYRTPTNEPEKNELEASQAIDDAIEASSRAMANADKKPSLGRWIKRGVYLALLITVVVGFVLGSLGSHEAMLVGAFALIMLLMVGLGGLMGGIPVRQGPDKTFGVSSYKPPS